MTWCRGRGSQPFQGQTWLIPTCIYYSTPDGMSKVLTGRSPSAHGLHQQRMRTISRRTTEQAVRGTRMATFTQRQGQFLAFVHLYRLLHKQGPAELDMVKFFRVTPPSVHQMIVKLEELG